MTTAQTSLPSVGSADRDLEGEAGVEFVNGQIVEKPVSIESSRVEARIHVLLSNHAYATNSADVFTSSMGYRCYADDPLKFRKPVVSVVCAERMAQVDLTGGFMPVPADLAVEVISPNDLFYDVAEKVEEYLENGFRLVWIVNPPTKTVEIHRPDGSGSRLHEGDEITGETALPSFKCKVGDFFPIQSPQAMQPSDERV